VGYTGGSNPHPTYESVCAGDGHTEAIKIEYDPSKVSYDALLSKFHNGCSGHSGGNPQYKSAVWVHSEEQRAVAQEVAKSRGRSSRLQIENAPAWHDAEGYHQKYYQKQGCHQM